jgi:hypothetical protein
MPELPVQTPVMVRTTEDVNGDTIASSVHAPVILSYCDRRHRCSDHLHAILAPSRGDVCPVLGRRGLVMGDDAYAKIARLEAELARRDRALAGAREQQAATAEILRIIATSPSDLQLILNTVIERAAVLCGADTGVLQRQEGDIMRGVARYGTRLRRLAAEGHEGLRSGPPMSRSSVAGRAMLERRTIHVPDVLAVMDTVGCPGFGGVEKLASRSCACCR